MNKHLTTSRLVYMALLVALAVILQSIRIYTMPQGGSVTAAAMVPLLLLSYRFGPVAGAMAGGIFGMINLFMDPYILHPVQVLFDYPLPYMCMGLAGLFRDKIYIGTGLAFIGRFICHVFSGVVFFSEFAPEGMSPLVYSLVFNSTYLIPEYILCCIVLKLLPLKRLLAAMAGGRN